MVWNSAERKQFLSILPSYCAQGSIWPALIRYFGKYGRIVQSNKNSKESRFRITLRKPTPAYWL